MFVGGMSRRCQDGSFFGGSRLARSGGSVMGHARIVNRQASRGPSRGASCGRHKMEMLGLVEAEGDHMAITSVTGPSMASTARGDSPSLRCHMRHGGRPLYGWPRLVSAVAGHLGVTCVARDTWVNRSRHRGRGLLRRWPIAEDPSPRRHTRRPMAEGAAEGYGLRDGTSRARHKRHKSA